MYKERLNRFLKERLNIDFNESNFNVEDYDFDWVAFQKTAPFSVGGLIIVISKHPNCIPFIISSAVSLSKYSGIPEEYMIEIIKTNNCSKTDIVKAIFEHSNLSYTEVFKMLFQNNSNKHIYIYRPLTLMSKLKEKGVFIRMTRPNEKGFYETDI